MIRIYCDGVFDLFHKGHRRHLKLIKELYNDVYLIVGIISDNDTNEYKRLPIFNEELRFNFINSCKYVNLAIKNAVPIITEDFLTKYKIDLVVHAFVDENDFDQQMNYFKIPISLGKFKRLEYNQGISTTSIITSNDWLNSHSSTSDITNNIDIIDNILYNRIINYLDINNKQTLLEINSGKGLLAKKLEDRCIYTGLDKCQKNVTYHLNTYKHRVLCLDLEEEDLIFSDNQFDYIIGNNINIENSFVINELKRVAKKAVILLYFDKITNFRHLTDFKIEKFKSNYDTGQIYYQLIYVA